MKQLSSYDLLSSCRCHLSSWTPLSQSTTIGLFSMVGANSVVPYIRMETTLCIVEDVFAKLMSSFVSARIKVVHWTGRRPTVFLLMAPSRLPISIHGHSAYISMRRQFSQSFTLCQKIWTVPVDCGALLNHSAGTQKSRSTGCSNRICPRDWKEPMKTRLVLPGCKYHRIGLLPWAIQADGCDQPVL